ncbi:MAG: hypothetical protein H6667_09040 [Ardenticatenaceae bacterium]|nr:hypothetical protein [Ardenticatenaceae bacterium]MCB9445208.1 hypothetical protein [Ardenticatenaceae bacterium]
MNPKTISLKTPSATGDLLDHKRLLLLLLFGVLIALGLVVTKTVWQPGSAANQAISAQTLADKYGVKVNLVAVTAAGGLVDLRMQILNAEKAKQLFQDTGDIPTLQVQGHKGALIAPEDSGKQLLNTLEDGNNVFLMYPNVSHAVRPSKPVTIVFGDVALEPIAAQ